MGRKGRKGARPGLARKPIHLLPFHSDRQARTMSMMSMVTTMVTTMATMTTTMKKATTMTTTSPLTSVRTRTLLVRVDLVTETTAINCILYACHAYIHGVTGV